MTAIKAAQINPGDTIRIGAAKIRVREVGQYTGHDHREVLAIYDYDHAPPVATIDALADVELIDRAYPVLQVVSGLDVRAGDTVLPMGRDGDGFRRAFRVHRVEYLHDLIQMYMVDGGRYTAPIHYRFVIHREKR